MDEATLELVLKLSFEDVESRKAVVFGKSRAGPVLTDEQLAIREHAASLKAALQDLADARLAQSVNNALGSDLALLRQLEARERMELNDRNLALRLAGVQSAGGSNAASGAGTPLRSPFGAATPIRTASGTPYGLRTPLTPPTPARAIPSFKPPRIQINCVVCMEPIGPKTYIRAPCGDHYDEKCLVQLVQSASTDESLFPVRCCKQEIPVKDILPLLSREVRPGFERAISEFSTPAMQRIYCSNKKCSRFVEAAGNSTFARSVQCPACRTYTCAKCREPAHHRFVLCERKEDTESLKELIKENKWQQCPSCHRIVELTQGCYHMTCICRAQFCYLCAVDWKNCECPQWEERLLLDEATRRVNAQLRDVEPPRQREQGFLARQRNAAARNNLIQEAVDLLRTNHHCNHSWYVRHGAANCSHCGNYLSRYLLNCRDCRTAVCVRCARNRL